MVNAGKWWPNNALCHILLKWRSMHGFTFTFTKQEHKKKKKKNEGKEPRSTNKPRRKSAQHAPLVFPKIYNPVSRINFDGLVPTAGAPAEGGRQHAAAVAAATNRIVTTVTRFQSPREQRPNSQIDILEARLDCQLLIESAQEAVGSRHGDCHQQPCESPRHRPSRASDFSMRCSFSVACE